MSQTINNNDILVDSLVKEGTSYFYITQDKYMTRRFVFSLMDALSTPELFADIIKSMINGRTQLLMAMYLYWLDEEDTQNVLQCLECCQDIANVKIIRIDDAFHQTIVLETDFDNPTYSLKVACTYGSDTRVHAEAKIIGGSRTIFVDYSIDGCGYYDIQDMPYLSTEERYVSSVIGHILYYHTNKSDVATVSRYLRKFSMYYSGISFFAIDYFIRNREESSKIIIEILDHILVYGDICRVIANLIVSVCINVSNIGVHVALLDTTMLINQYVQEKHPALVLDVRRASVHEYMKACNIFTSIRIKAPIITDINGIDIRKILRDINGSNREILMRAFEVFSNISPFSPCLRTYRASNAIYYLYVDGACGSVYVRTSHTSAYVRDVVFIFYNTGVGCSHYQCITSWYMCPYDRSHIKSLFDMARKVCPTLYPLGA